MSFVAV